jgi:Leucine-rich repeat (LRR) protein
MQEKKNRLKQGFFILALTLSAGCSSKPYKVVLNNNVVYSPNPALLNQTVSDPALQGCLNQVLASMENGSVETIKLLACPDAGIKSLDGIAALAALEQLELSNNSIDNLGALQPLRNLRVLSLRNNRIMNIGPIQGLPLLRFVALEGNDRIPCRQLDELGEKLGATLSRPASCTR